MKHMFNLEIAQISPYKELFVADYQADKIIEVAEDLLGGILSLGYKNMEIQRYNPHRLQRFDWNRTVQKNANTFSLYLLGLRHIYLLAEAARLNGCSYYLSLAEDFVDSYYQYLNAGENLNGMTNNDHALAERIENLVYLYFVAQTNNYSLHAEMQLTAIIEDAVDKLLGDKYYQRNHNHGIIVDKAALIGVYFLNKEDMKEKIEFLVERLKRQVTYAYTPDGVHKENSIDYHISITGLLLGCASILKYIGHAYYDELDACLRRANDFLVYALKPDGARPLFGDSKGRLSEDYQKSIELQRTPSDLLFSEKNKQLEYIYSQGAHGDMPSKLCAHFPCGYVFFREHFRKNDFKMATWLSLKAGYTTRVHKHRDDLSICLFSKGFDIFVDAGMCGYMPRDKYKDYVESVPAHTTIGIKGRPYSIAGSNGEKFRLQRCFRTTHYDYALASARVYEDAVIYRHIYFLRNLNMILIRDELFSQGEQDYVQYFHLSNAVTLDHAEPQRVELRIGNTDYVAVVRQLHAVDGLEVLEGENTEPISMVSTGFGSVEASKTLSYTVRRSSAEFLTCIEIKQRNMIDREISLLPESVVIGNIQIPIAKTEFITFKGADIQIVDDKILITNLGDLTVERFALYAYRSGKTDEVEKVHYTANRQIICENKNRDDIVLLYYIANSTGELIKGILGECLYAENGTTEIKRYEQLHFPRVKGHSVQQLEDGSFLFSVHVDYDYPAVCRWWVYCDGANIYFEDNNRYQLTYTFQKPGEYVVMYSFRDKYFGEFVFEQFEKIAMIDGAGMLVRKTDDVGATDFAK